MMFTQRSLEHQWFYSLKVLAQFRSNELVDFCTYNTQILCLTGATVKHVLRKIKITKQRLHNTVIQSRRKIHTTNTINAYISMTFVHETWRCPVYITCTRRYAILPWWWRILGRSVHRIPCTGWIWTLSEHASGRNMRVPCSYAISVIQSWQHALIVRQHAALQVYFTTLHCKGNSIHVILFWE
jgi:hypothetical protein